MSYPAFGKVKTIVLPIPSTENTYTIEEYKNHFGIDLREFISLATDSIRFHFGDSLVLLKVTKELASDVSASGKPVCLAPIDDIEVGGYEAGLRNGYTKLIDNINDVVLLFTIKKDVDFTIDNIEITSGEY